MIHSGRFTVGWNGDAGIGRAFWLLDACLTWADGHAKRVADLHMIEPRAERPCRITLDADKGYDAKNVIHFDRQGGLIRKSLRDRTRRLAQFDRETARSRRSSEYGRVTHAALRAKLKPFRRIAARFEKAARNVHAIVTIAAIVLWLR